ncbi:MAG: isoaspartyl peptidase/L-asparaginase, partial [Cereibacter changlensis]
AYRAAAGGLEARLATPAGEVVEGLLRPRPDLLRRGGTVGAVARDRCGDLAAASSTGGFGSKLSGRVGDTPLIGAGTYADNRTVAISTTGHGEYFIRHTVAAQIAGRLRFGDETLAEALRHVIVDELSEVGGDGGVIAVDASGRVEIAFNTDGMVRGWTTDRLPPQTMTGGHAP